MRSAALFSMLAIGAADLIVVDLVGAPLNAQVSAQVCAGLGNRDTNGDAHYMLIKGEDTTWLNDTAGIVDPPLTAIDDYLRACLSGANNANAAGYVRVNLTSQVVFKRLEWCWAHEAGAAGRPDQPTTGTAAGPHSRLLRSHEFPRAASHPADAMLPPSISFSSSPAAILTRDVVVRSGGVGRVRADLTQRPSTLARPCPRRPRRAQWCRT